jgi:hypothetical protein
MNLKTANRRIGEWARDTDLAVSPTRRFADSSFASE